MVVKLSGDGVTQKNELIAFDWLALESVTITRRALFKPTPFPSYSKPLFKSEAWSTTDNEFNLHVNEISFSYERMSTKTRFEKEANGNFGNGLL